MDSRWTYRGAALVASMLGCGRVGFDSISGTGDASTPVPLCADFPGVLFCDDFETGIDDYFYSAQGTNRVELDGTRFRSGSASLHIFADSQGPAWIIAGSALSDITSGTLSARFYQWIPASVEVNDFTLLSLVNRISPYPGIATEAVSGAVARIRSTASGEPGTMVLPRDRWYCFQFSVDISDTGSASVHFDGQEAASFAGDTLPAGGYSNIHVGTYLLTESGTPTEMWIDDLIVDSQPVACE